MAPISQLWSIFLAFGPFHSSAWVPVFPIHHSRALNKLFLRATGLQTPINEYVIRFPNDKATFEVFFFLMAVHSFIPLLQMGRRYF